MNDDLSDMFDFIETDRTGYLDHVHEAEVRAENARLRIAIKEAGVEKFHFSFSPEATPLQRMEAENRIFTMWVNGETFEERKFPPGF